MKPSTRKPVYNRDKISTHRSEALKENVRISLSCATAESLQRLATQQCMNIDLTVQCLLDLYELRDLDLLIDRLRRHYYRGLTPTQINQMSVLFSLLQMIDRQIGLT